MSSIILFDIDGTLIDTWHLREHMAEVASIELKISKEIYTKAHNSFVASLEHPHDFNPATFFPYLVKQFGSSAEYLLEKFYTAHAFETFLFPDTVPALKRLAQSRTLGIFSEGFTSFQMKKLELAGLTKYFDPKYIFIFRRKLLLQSVQMVPKNALIIDDSTEVVKTLLAEKFNARVIDRKRKSSRGSPVISSLNEL